MPFKRPFSSPSSPGSGSRAVSRRKMSQARELWIDYFSSALSTLTDSDKEMTEAEASELVDQAAILADKALSKTEERFPGL